MSRYRFTSESVTEGHPDKLCDAVTDSILDAILTQDKHSRVACESLAKTGMVVVAGEITTNAILDYPVIVRNAVREIGYTSSEMGFDAETCAVLVAVEKQSPDISQGVTEGEGLHKEQGAGDQGLMFGFAVDETPNLMPAPIRVRARPREGARRRPQGRRRSKFLRPDGKTQVTLEYEDDRPARIDAIVVSTQHDEDVKYKHLREAVDGARHREGAPEEAPRQEHQVPRQPDRALRHRRTAGRLRAHRAQDHRRLATAAWAVTAAARSAARTRARSIASACYYARFIAKNVVASGVARKCEVQVAYAIGVAKPVGVHVNTFGTGKISDEKLEEYILEHFDMRPKALIDELGLLAPIYKATSAYGHFGRSEFSWEKTNRAAKIAADLLGGKPKGKALAMTNGHANGNGSSKKDKKERKKEKKKAKALAAEA